MASEALSIRDVDTYYGDSHVLHRIGFTLQSGKLLGLLGRNGAGKTTCMATIMGFLRPRRGAISLFGEPVAGLAPETIARKGICLVPQGRRVFRSLTVRENLAVAAQTRNQSDKPWTIERVFDLFPRLRERHGQYAGSLSGGEQQMLAIGRALMSRPRLLLLDEPSLGLAPLMVERIFETIAELKRQGLTILLVEQNVHHALDIADRAYVMETGRITLDGPAEVLRRDPQVERSYLGA